MHQLEPHKRDQANSTDHQDAINYRVKHSEALPLVDPTRADILAATPSVLLAPLWLSKRDSGNPVSRNFKGDAPTPPHHGGQGTAPERSGSAWNRTPQRHPPVSSRAWLGAIVRRLWVRSKVWFLVAFVP